MRLTLKRSLSLVLVLVMCLSLIPIGAMLAAADVQPPDDESHADTPTLKQMEYLTRGLVATTLSGTNGVFMSWRFLGDEPDGISWNIYRSNDQGETWSLITTIEPRDVLPESNFATNPGIVKENVTPSNYTDTTGTAASIYEVAPVIDGVEGQRQGMSVPMLSRIGTTANTFGEYNIPVGYLRPGATRRPQFEFRGQAAGHGDLMNNTAIFIPASMQAGSGTTSALAHRYFKVDMDLFREFHSAYNSGTAVTQQQIDGWVARLNVLNKTRNWLGNAVIPAGAPDWAPTVALPESGLISEALFKEMEWQFLMYVDNLDMGPQLPFRMTTGGAIASAASGTYNIHEMAVGDFTGNGEYDIAFKWQANSVDPMFSDPINHGAAISAPIFVDVVDLQGNLLLRADLGYNVKANNDHETVLFVQDFDNSGRASLMLKTAGGTRLGNWVAVCPETCDAGRWCRTHGSVVYEDTLETVVGGEWGLQATRPMIEQYINTGDTVNMNRFWMSQNSWSIIYRNPRTGTGNDGQNIVEERTWVKSYHVGNIGLPMDPEDRKAGITGEFFSAFKFDPETQMGFIVDSADYPFPFSGSIVSDVDAEYYDYFDGRNWGLGPMSQRGAYGYAIYPDGFRPPGRNPNMMPSEQYWLENRWGHWPLGDAQGNRPNRYLGGTGMMDGENWFAISQRGYYERTTVSVFRIIDGKVVNQANFDSKNPLYWVLKHPQCKDETCVYGNRCEYYCNWYFYQNRGNHQAFVGDVNFDGRCEYVTGAMTLTMSECNTMILPLAVHGGDFASFVNQNGTPRNFPVGRPYTEFNTLSDSRWWPLRHGDRGALLPVDSTNTVRIWSCQEEHIVDDFRSGRAYNWSPNSTVKDGATGLVVQASYGPGSDWENGTAGNFTNAVPGALAPYPNMPTEFGGANALRSMNMSTGELMPAFVNLGGGGAIWFTGKLTHDHVTGGVIRRAHPINGFTTGQETWTIGANYNHTVGTNKSSVPLKADFWGDWREEILVPRTANVAGMPAGPYLTIITTLLPSEYGIRTLMHDPMYRGGVSTHNNGYSQHHFAGFYLGDEAPLPAQRNDIRLGALDKAALAELVADIEALGLDKDDYTTESWNAFAAALSNANEVLVKTSLHHYQVDEAYDALLAAFEGLALTVFASASTNTRSFISMTETSKNSRVWTLRFVVVETYCNGTTKNVIYSINLNGNNANLDGKYTFTEGLLIGYTLVYDIKGNGSNIKELKLIK